MLLITSFYPCRSHLMRDRGCSYQYMIIMLAILLPYVGWVSQRRYMYDIHPDITMTSLLPLHMSGMCTLYYIVHNFLARLKCLNHNIKTFCPICSYSAWRMHAHSILHEEVCITMPIDMQML